MSKTMKNGHLLYTDGDDDIPVQILDSNGQVVLDLCKTCGKGEVELTQDCTARPLVDVTDMVHWPSRNEFGAPQDLSGEVVRLDRLDRVVARMADGREVWIEHNNHRPLIVTNCQHWEEASAIAVPETVLPAKDQLLLLLSKVVEGIPVNHPEVVSRDVAGMLALLRADAEEGQ